MPRKKICDMDCFNCSYEDCINDHIRIRRPLTEEEKESERQKRRDRYKIYKESGRCVDCGKPFDAKHGKQQNYRLWCYECAIKRKRIGRARMNKGVREYRRENELCYYCGAERVEGHKVCEKHLKTLVKSVEYAREFRTEENNVFKKENKLHYAKMESKMREKENGVSNKKSCD